MAGSPQVTKSSGAGMGRAEESQINHSRLVVRGSNWSRVNAQHIQIIQELSPASSEVERSAFNRVVVGSIPTMGGNNGESLYNPNATMMQNFKKYEYTTTKMFHILSKTARLVSI